MAKLSMDDLKRIDLDGFKAMDKRPIIIIIDNIRSALNVGSIFRTADAFAIREILLCGITATPPNREINKTAIGATESVDWQYIETTTAAIEYCRQKGYHIYGIEQTDDSISLSDFDTHNHPIAIILGNEVDGVDSRVIRLCDGCIEIPQYGTKHSLNVSVAAGIVLWEITT